MNSLKAMNEKAEAVEAELIEKVTAKALALSDREQEELLEKLKEEMK